MQLGLFSWFLKVPQKAALLLCLLLPWLIPTATAEVLSHLPLKTLAPSAAGEYDIGGYTAILEDPGHELALNDAINAGQWQLSNSNNPNFGFSSSAYWLAARIQTPEQLNDWYIRIHYALLDRVDIYTCPQSGSAWQMAGIDIDHCHHQVIGDSIPFHQRLFDHPELIARLPELTQAGANHAEATDSDAQATAARWLIFRMETEGTYQFPAGLVNQQTLYDDLLLNSVVRGGYISMMLIMGLYNLFLFFPTRDRTFLYYSGFVLSFLLFHMSYAGGAFQHFWPNYPHINDYALPWLFSLNLLTVSLFIPRFLNLRENSPASHRLFRGFQGITLMTLVANLVVPYQPMVAIQNLLTLTITLSALFLGIRFWLRGIAAARLFTLAWVFFIAGLALANARSLGLIPTNLFTLYGYQAGSFVEIILLSLALGERITQLQRDKLESRKALLTSKEESIHHLRAYEDLYQNSFTGQFQLDEQGYFIKSNPAWRSMLQLETLPQHLTLKSLFVNNAGFVAVEQQLVQHGRIQGFVCAIHPPGRQAQVMISLSLRQGLEGEQAHWIGSAQDVSEKYQKEEKLRRLQEEKNQSLRQLVMGVAHEMNTPLGNIRMAQTFLTEQNQRLQRDDQQLCGDGLNHIGLATERLRELNQLMKDAVVLDKDYGVAQINIRDWFSCWINSKAEQFSQIQLSHEVHSFAIEWQTYPEALEKILEQLVTNSLNHNPSLADTGTLSASIHLRDNNDSLVLRYRDNGSGISAEQQQQVFLPFYTTQRQQASNKGLGLYQTYNLVTELMQGCIHWPENPEGFDIELRFPLSH